MWLYFDVAGGGALTDDDGHEIARLSRWDATQEIPRISFDLGGGQMHHRAGLLEGTVNMEFYVTDFDAFNQFMQEWMARRKVD